MRLVDDKLEEGLISSLETVGWRFSPRDDNPFFETDILPNSIVRCVQREDVRKESGRVSKWLCGGDRALPGTSEFLVSRASEILFVCDEYGIDGFVRDSATVSMFELAGFNYPIGASARQYGRFKVLLKPREVEAILSLAIDIDELRCYFLRFDEPRFVRGHHGLMWLIDNDPHQPLPFDIGELQVNDEVSHLFMRSY